MIYYGCLIFQPRIGFIYKKKNMQILKKRLEEKKKKKKDEENNLTFDEFI